MMKTILTISFLLMLHGVLGAQNTPQEAVEILTRSHSELNRTNVFVGRAVPRQNVSTGWKTDLLPGTVTYRPTQNIVHIAPVPEVIVRLVK